MIHLDHEFRVPLPVEQAWAVLTDLPKVARCLPGAYLDTVLDGRYDGGLSTRIGPISAKYRGTASFVERDEIDHRAVVEARGQEEKGSGTATALITLALAPEGDATQVQVRSELAISGKAAQFGRSLLAEVSTSMLGTFVRNLEQMIEAGEHRDGSGGGSAGMNGVPAQRPPRTERLEPAGPADGDQLDVLRAVVLPVLRRSAGPLAATALGLLAGLALGRAGRRGARGPAAPTPITLVLPWPELARALDASPRWPGR